MNNAYSPRLDCFDVSTVEMALKLRLEHVPELLQRIESDPAKEFQQQHWSGLACDYETIAFYSYGLGHSLDAVIDAFQNAARAFLNVVRLRGTLPPFEAYVVEPAHQGEGDPEGIEFTIRPLNDTQSRDFSLSNSRDNYYAVCEARIAGDRDSAMELARMICDPPDASYIGPNSFCTPADQKLAYALRAFYEGRTSDIESELRKLRTRSDGIRSQATMLRALGAGDGAVFLEGLDSLLRWHEKDARSKENRGDPEFFMSIPAVGLSGLAVDRGICRVNQLPSESPFLPIDLLKLSTRGD